MQSLTSPNKPEAKPISRQRKWQLKQQAMGNCTVCGETRADASKPEVKPLSMRCRKCQDDWNRYQRDGTKE